MNTPDSSHPVSPSPTESHSLILARAVLQEAFFLVGVYFLVALIGTAFMSACGPGCCFVFFSIIAGFSGLLMLVRPIGSRCVCFLMLLLSLYGMWHEKETRDTHRQRLMQSQIDHLREALEKSQSE